MNYVLTILSSGRPVYLERTLNSYMQFLNPEPSAVYLFNDGPCLKPLPLDLLPQAPDFEWSDSMLGQCSAQAYCWQAAAESEHEWAFHVEDDVVLLRPLDLRNLAAVMERESTLAQMALVRCPWGAEIEYGGYIPMVPGHYTRRQTACNTPRHRGELMEWIATTRNWANAPALYRTELARSYTWPARPGCETTVGPELIARDPDTVFGLWGAGEPWVAHIGVERAPGSHGY